jgi:4'-phosphopantetheinyl transferase
MLAPTWPAADVIVICVETSVRRDQARDQLRQATIAQVATLLQLAPQAISINATPGLAPSITVTTAAGARQLPCSFAHDDGLSLAAINISMNITISAGTSRAVGVDLMRVRDVPDWQRVAADYLGPQATAALSAIARQAPDDLARAFAQAWTDREARLKSLGLPLREWQAHDPGSAPAWPLTLPRGFVGSISHFGDRS